MVKYKKIFLLCLIILFVSMAGVSASDSNQTDDALGVSDSGDVLGTNPETFSDLQSIINGNESGAIINLTNDYVANGVDGVVIDKELTINGNGHILDAEKKNYVFKLSTSSKVTLNDLIFTNSSSAAVYSNNVETNTEFNNCTFVNFTSYAFNSQYGGGHLFNGCRFVNGTCKGAIYLLNTNTKPVENKFIDCEFVNNNASSIDDSGICAIYSNTDFDLIRCNFTNNYAEQGSTIFIGSNYKISEINVNVVNSTFRENNKGQIIKSTDNYNTFINLNVSGSDFYDNNLSRSTGVIWLRCPSTVSINDTNFYNNNILWDCAVIYLQSQTIFNFTNVNVTENVRAVYAKISGDCSIKDSTFKNGVSKSDGAALHVTGFGDLVVENSYFINNSAEYDIFYPRGDEIKYYGSGGAIYISLDSSSNVTFIDAVFENNTAGIDGGAICVASNLNKLLIINSKFINNTPYSNPKKDSLSPTGGGAIYISSDIDDLNIIASDFINNTAKSGGAIIYVGNEPLNIKDCKFLDNKITSVNVKIRAYSTDDIEVILTGGNTQIDAVYTSADVVTYSNVDYSTDKGILNTDVVYSNYSLYIPFQNVTIEFYDRTTQSNATSTNMTNEKGVAKFRNLNIENGDKIKAYHEDNTQYPYGEAETNVEEMGEFTILQGLISDTPFNGVLELTRNYTFTPGLDDPLIGGITIDKDMTIIGNGFTINGLNQSRIFYAPYEVYEYGPSICVSNVILDNISFADYKDYALYVAWT